MDAQEMKYEFEVRVDVLSGSTAYGLTDEEISSFLNIAQDKVIEETYKSSGIDLLTELVTNFTSASPDTTYTVYKNVYGYDWANLTDDLFIPLTTSILITRTNPAISTGEFTMCEKISKETMNSFLTTTFNKPWFEQPKIFFEDNEIIIIVDSFTDAPENLNIDYIKRPTTIVVDTGGSETDCELRDTLHKKVVEVAAELAVNDHQYMPDKRMRNRRDYIDSND